MTVRFCLSTSNQLKTFWSIVIIQIPLPTHTIRIRGYEEKKRTKNENSQMSFQNVASELVEKKPEILSIIYQKIWNKQTESKA